jgi:hypothetical protein
LREEAVKVVEVGLSHRRVDDGLDRYAEERQSEEENKSPEDGPKGAKHR